MVFDQFRLLTLPTTKKNSSTTTPDSQDLIPTSDLRYMSLLSIAPTTIKISPNLVLQLPLRRERIDHLTRPVCTSIRAPKCAIGLS